MSTSLPFIGEHAEYYRRRTLRAVARPDTLSRENEQLRQRVIELEDEISLYKQRVQLLEQRKVQKNLVRRILEKVRALRT